MGWWLCAAAVRLRAQIDARWPGRDHSSDGAVGDTSHAARASDHNPSSTSTPLGVVRAIDIDEDFTGPDDPLANRLLAEMLDCGDLRIKYLIFEGLIWQRKAPSMLFASRPYKGANAHLSHIHVSFAPAGDHDGKPFDLPMLEVPT